MPDKTKTDPSKPMRLVLIGVGGHGLEHLKTIQSLQDSGIAELVAVADPFPEKLPEVVAEMQASGVRWHREHRALLREECSLDGVVICTPIPLHQPMLEDALRLNSARILLEKPALPTIQQLDAAIRIPGSERVRVGFHMIFWPQVQTLRKWVSAGSLGRIRRVTVSASWPRSTQYYKRASWAGRMMQGDSPVFDGPATNGLAHLLHNVAYLLAPEGKRTLEPSRVRGVLARARKIESYDTTWIEAEFGSISAHFLLSHAVDRYVPFVIRIEGENGTAELTGNAPFLWTDLPGLAVPECENSKLPMYRSFLAAPDIFEEMPNTLGDVRAHTLLSNAALVSSDGIREVPPGEVVDLPGDDQPVAITHLPEAIEKFRSHPLPLPEFGFAWGTPGSWVDAHSMTQLDLRKYPNVPPR